MNFTANKHYYIYNFGIDFNTIFFSQRNKEYFTKKIYEYIKPYAKVISIKLADNQFHILIKTKKDYSGKMLNHNIGIMLRSYTRAVNKERNRIGSLFCRHTKAFSKISDIPKRLREYVKPFIIFLSRGKLVNFSKSINNFFDFMKTDIKYIGDSPLSFKNLFKHPLKSLKLYNEKKPQYNST